jgi:hypothetical protein
MIIIEDTLISEDIYTEKFICDVSKCKGACCVEGDLGAPLIEAEIKILEDNYEKFKQFMRAEGITAIENQGKYCKGDTGDLTTPLINNKDCAYVIFDENNIAKCAIEKAFEAKLIDFQKPISCHLYPIRITEYSNYDGINYNRWDICNCAVAKGKKKNLPVYKFLKEPLIRKYGEDWFTQLDEYAKTK